MITHLLENSMKSGDKILWTDNAQDELQKLLNILKQTFLNKS